MKKWKLYNPREGRLIAEAVIEAAAYACYARADELRSGARTSFLLTPRYAAVYVLHARDRMSHSMIARHMGGRHSTTILNAYRQACLRMETDADFRSLVERLWPELRKAA